MNLLTAVVSMAQGNYLSEIAAIGYSAVSRDLSDSVRLDLVQPALAYVNLVSPTGFPDSKTADLHDWVEYYDADNDAYFRKRVIANLQGQSSLSFPKHNVAISFCEDEWVGEATTTVDFGGWVSQDAFHLKAFYGDWLRGVGIVGYQLYDEIERTLPKGERRIWQRAGVDAKKNARCYPDGFPCALYLNGDFYGIYTWQLKKHRRNMGQEKRNEQHIHLDGYLSEDTFWRGKINWQAFEVRNPKGLVTMGGSPYDGDAPAELADGPVKDAIVTLSHQLDTLTALAERSDVTDEQIRQQIASHFDVTSIINYLLFSHVVSNYDGFGKNWQWLTYDGVHWAVAPYDLDCTFGNYHEGTFLFPAYQSYINSTYTMAKSHTAITKWVWEYYFEELCDRYCDLRRCGVVSPEHIIELLYQWYYRIGPDLYEREWERWPDCYCISQTIVNDGWEATEEWLSYYGLAKWSDTCFYHQDDRCALDGRVWRATATTYGVRPYVQMGYTDSMQRLEEWVNERIEWQDLLFGFDDWLVSMPERRAGKATSQPAAAARRYGLDGIRRRLEGRGIAIDGHRTVVFHRR